MHISEFLEHKKISQDEFARHCGACKSTVYLWQQGKSIPSNEHMDKIRIFTGGLVTEEDIRAFVETKSNEALSVVAAAKALRIKPAAVLNAIRNGKIPAAKINKRWQIPVEAIEMYRKNKYNPENRLVGGKKIWNIVEGKISPQHAAKMLKITVPTLYKMIRRGKINAIMINGFYVIDAEEIEDIKNTVEDLKPLF